MCSSINTIPTSTLTTVFDIGNYTTSENVTSTPWPLLIFSPSEAGVFPVLLFLHGYLLCNSFYSQLFQHIASHGFVVVAPQLYLVAGLNTNGEINTTVEITNWLSQGLGPLLPPQVEPDLKKVALAGHSRGGKVAIAVALMKRSSISLNISALIGVDPVDGFAKGLQTPPPVLTYKPHSFNLDGIAALVIGSELGEAWNFILPPCAPKGVNHEDFYNECNKPAYHFVAKDYGHLDVLDDDAEGILCMTDWLCKRGKSREPMRTFVGGISVAFLNAYLEGDSTELVAIIQGREMVPVELQTVEFQV